MVLVSDLDARGIHFSKDGAEVYLLWTELNFLKRYRNEPEVVAAGNQVAADHAKAAKHAGKHKHSK